MSDDALCKHRLKICSRCITITDAARRMSGTINLYCLVRPWDELIHSCLAFRLDDGSSDGVLYPNRATALKYQLRPACVFYFRNSPGGCTPHDCQIFLNVNREAYQSDRIAWVDPESPDLIVSDWGYQNLKRVRPQ